MRNTRTILAAMAAGLMTLSAIPASAAPLARIGLQDFRCVAHAVCSPRAGRRPLSPP